MASSPRTLPNPVFRSPHACLTGPIALPHRPATYSVVSHAAGAMRWDGVDENLVRTVTEANLDHAPERRRIRSAFRDVQLGIDHCLFKAQYTGVVTKEWYVVNSRGLEIFSKSWIAENSPLKALVCFCHGYGDTCTFFFEGIAKKLASSGYGVFALDYPGFGLSDGLHGYIPSFDSLANDVAEHFAKIKENLEYKGLPSFLFGQSMGGAVALKVHFKQPNAWDGAVLVAPMCKMADNVVPPWPIQQILIGVAKILPKGKLVPQKDLAEMAFKDARKRELCSYNIIAYKDKPRLRTALEMLRTTQEIERRLEEVAWRLERPLEVKPMERGMFHGEAAGGHGVPAGILVTKSEVENNLVSLPLLILHGEADIVTDPSVSKALYEKASSSDKKLCLYKDAYHSLLEGESDESIFKVLDDIISWLDKHSVRRDL